MNCIKLLTVNQFDTSWRLSALLWLGPLLFVSVSLPLSIPLSIPVLARRDIVLLLLFWPRIGITVHISLNRVIRFSSIRVSVRMNPIIESNEMCVIELRQVTPQKQLRVNTSSEKVVQKSRKTIKIKFAFNLVQTLMDCLLGFGFSEP